MVACPYNIVFLCSRFILVSNCAWNKDLILDLKLSDRTVGDVNENGLNWLYDFTSAGSTKWVVTSAAIQPFRTSGCRTSSLIRKCSRKIQRSCCMHFVLKFGIECHVIRV